MAPIMIRSGDTKPQGIVPVSEITWALAQCESGHAAAGGGREVFATWAIPMWPQQPVIVGAHSCRYMNEEVLEEQCGALYRHGADMGADTGPR